ncbi:MAG: preprotein translocase subunit YajC [Candidatus Bipolaricaulis sp.]|nr:preprotein translocase subunit YajC [Candidatus Bipolaricaulis sp.]
MGRAVVACGLLLLVLSGAAWAQEVVDGTSTTSTSSGISQYLPLIILLVAFGGIFYFMLIRPQRKRQQEMNTLLSGLKRGDKVMTAGGIIAEIDSIGDTSVVLLLEEGSKLRMAKASIVRKLDK